MRSPSWYAMSSATVEGVLSSDNVLPQEPEKVADIVASAESLPADAGPLLNLREDQIQNAISFLSHPKVLQLFVFKVIFKWTFMTVVWKAVFFTIIYFSRWRDPARIQKSVSWNGKGWQQQKLMKHSEEYLTASLVCSKSLSWSFTTGTIELVIL